VTHAGTTLAPAGDRRHGQVGCTGSVLSGVLSIGGEGLDLGDRQVDGAGSGDSRQSATTPITTGVGGRISDLDRQRRGATQMSRAAIEGDGAGAGPLRHS